jgi:hypothetical protein
VAQARQQIPIICQNIDDAIRALDTGLDRSGNPVTKRQISDGLKRLVEATRNPGLVGLLTAVLASHGIQRFEHHMGELERIAEEIGRPDWIAPADKHASHMSAILEWCKRNRDKVVNVNVVSFSGEAHETTRNTAKGTIRSIEEHPHQKGVYRLEFDRQNQNQPYDFLILGFEVSEADDQGNRLVIQKGHNQRIELEAQEKAVPAEALPEPQQGAQDKPRALPLIAEVDTLSRQGVGIIDSCVKYEV